MTDALDYTARIRAKGLDSTGVTEDIARTMYANRGGHYMAIVELRVDETHDKADGQHKVDLIVTQVEPATEPKLDSHLRDLTRALYANRKLHDEDEQPELDGVGDVEPTVDQVMARGRQDTLPDPDSDDSGNEWEYPQGEGQDQEQEDTVPAT